MKAQRIFLLSPAHCGGKRAQLLFRAAADFELARRLREPGGAPLGEVFSFISGLYFRGKIAYARRYSVAPPGVPGALVITGGRGLMLPETPVTLADISRFCDVPIDLADARYRDPLLADLYALAATAGPAAQFVLLGSIATPKYLQLLSSRLAGRLLYPAIFAGMGDMQRGSRMLKAVESGEELAYVSAP